MTQMTTEQETPVRELPGAVEFTKTITEFDVYSFAGITTRIYTISQKKLPCAR